MLADWGFFDVGRLWLWLWHRLRPRFALSGRRLGLGLAAGGRFLVHLKGRRL
ncbi:MAG: hypothetical protein WBQ11_19215 [Isosphaeraceae bacterium]